MGTYALKEPEINKLKFTKGLLSQLFDNQHN
jgi:hypothetical protein